MRRLGFGLAVCAGTILFLSSVQAQQFTSQPPVFGTGFSPLNPNSRPIDPSKAMMPAAGFRNAAQTPFGLSRIFPKISLGKWPPTRPNHTMLTKSPFQPKPIPVTNPYFKK